MGQPVDIGARVVPLEIAQSKLRACMSCSLIKTVNQFNEYGCENCPFLKYQGDRERISVCTTSQFVGSYVMMKPSRSWVAKWQRVTSFVPGAYAIKIESKIPDDMLELFEENRIRLHNVLATADTNQ